MADDQRKTGRSVLEKTRAETREPELYSVILLNDDYTTMEFVVQVLESVFNKGPAEAFRIMMQVHTQGQGLCGVFPWDIAETRVTATHDLARERGFPLRAIIEKA
jgi:ATP-dependent Clp protease adaptor protein ClpS